MDSVSVYSLCAARRSPHGDDVRSRSHVGIVRSDWAMRRLSTRRETPAAIDAPSDCAEHLRSSSDQLLGRPTLFRLLPPSLALLQAPCWASSSASPLRSRLWSPTPRAFAPASAHLTRQHQDGLPGSRIAEPLCESTRPDLGLRHCDLPAARMDLVCLTMALEPLTRAATRALSRPTWAQASSSSSRSTCADSQGAA